MNSVLSEIPSRPIFPAACVIFWPSARANMPLQSGSFLFYKLCLWTLFYLNSHRGQCFQLLVLYFDLRPKQICHYKVIYRKEVTHSNGQWLKEIAWVDLADEMGQGKAYDILIDWCSGRQWPVNCMTVISAGWRSSMPFQRSSGRSSGRWTII